MPKNRRKWTAGSRGVDDMDATQIAADRKIIEEHSMECGRGTGVPCRACQLCCRLSAALTALEESQKEAARLSKILERIDVMLADAESRPKTYAALGETR